MAVPIFRNSHFPMILVAIFCNKLFLKWLMMRDSVCLLKGCRSLYKQCCHFHPTISLLRRAIYMWLKRQVYPHPTVRICQNCRDKFDARHELLNVVLPEIQFFVGQYASPLRLMRRCVCLAHMHLQKTLFHKKSAKRQ